MRVLVNHLLEPGNRITGISKYLFALLGQLLSSEQHHYILLTAWHREQLPEALQHERLTVVTLPYIASTPANVWFQWRNMRRYMQQYQADLEFCCNPLTSFSRRWPKLIVVHDLYFDVAPAAYRWRHRLWWRWLFPLSAKAAWRIVCVSENTKNDVVKYYPQLSEKLQVIGEGPCLAVPQQPDAELSRRQPFGLFVANVSPNKGANTLVRAMQLLQQSGIAIDIKHVGADPCGNFQRYADDIGSELMPQTLGYVSDDRLSTLYSQARFLAFPSHYEGFGLPVIEAQAHATPVIASDIPVLREVAGEGALYFAVDDAQALAKAMQRLLSDDELFSRLSASALLNQRRYSWKKAAAETEQLFIQAVEQNTVCPISQVT